MSPKARLPLVELADQAKIEVETGMAKVRDENSEEMIGRMCGTRRGNRRAEAG
jgi:hypothetical protein